MSRASLLTAMSLLFVVGCSKAQKQSEAVQSGAAAQPNPPVGNQESKISNAQSAAPAAIASNATILDWPAKPDQQPVELRHGSNGWACFPDMPTTPTNDPVCFDPVWQEWGQAIMAHKPFSTKSAGIAYMLQGASDASNSDPFKTKPDSGQEWVKSGPHVMLIYPDGAALASMTSDYTKGVPWVMFKGTPFAHVMVPVAK